jgi:formate/nitrite transporter FocA (FNT family)
MAEVFGFDCYAPKEIAERVENVGVTKALGNLVGGAGVVGLVYWVIYCRNTSSSAKASPTA